METAPRPERSCEKNTTAPQVRDETIAAGAALTQSVGRLDVADGDVWRVHGRRKPDH